MSPERVAADLRRTDSVIASGWQFAFSQADSVSVFSATLHPRGRGSSEEDWRFLDAVMGELQLPADAVRQITRQGASRPSGVLGVAWAVG